jgi:hypothetical protein
VAKIEEQHQQRGDVMTVRDLCDSSQRKPLYSKEEFAKRGHEIYEDRIRSLVAVEHDGKIVAIDIETGEFEIAEESLIAAKQLLARCPDAQIFGMRIGHPAVHRFDKIIYNSLTVTDPPSIN